MKRKFCCDASSAMYEDYYVNQSGSGLPVFQGARGQLGHGLGSILSGFFRSAMPVIKSGLAAFGKQALRTGAQIASDMLEGQSFSDSARKRVGDTIKQYVSTASDQSGSGRRRRRINRAVNIRRVHFVPRKSKRPKRDIFD